MEKELTLADFETLTTRAKEILIKMGDPSTSLSDSITLYKEGMSQLENATRMLEEAKLVIEEYEGKMA